MDDLKNRLMILSKVVALLSAFLFAAPTSASERRIVPWYVVTVEGSALGGTVENAFLFSRIQQRESGRSEFWIAERSLKDIRPGIGGTKSSHGWIDSRECPALGPVLAEISKLPPMKLEAPEREIDIRPPADLAKLKISGPVSGQGAIGGARISYTEFLGPKFKWWTEAQKLLDSCWHDRNLEIDGKQVTPLLSQDRDIEYWKSW